MIRSGIRRVFHLALRRRDRWEREVEDEIKLHLALRAEQIMAEGRAPEAAYEEAVRRFGPLDESCARLVEAARHRETRMRRTEYLGEFRQDIAFASRTFGRRKGWTVITLLTLALGIGAAMAVFSVVSTLLLHILPYPQADRIVVVNQTPRVGSRSGISVTIAPSRKAIEAWREQSHTFEALEPASIGPLELKTESGEPSVVMTAAVLPSFLAFAGVRPIRGRMFTDDEAASGDHLALLAEGFWRERLGADPHVLGKALTVGDSLYTIIGVLPAALRFGSPGYRPTDIWLPMNLREPRSAGSLLGRLRPGATITQAERELDSIYARTEGLSGGSTPFVTVINTPAQRVQFRDSLVLLAVAVALLLLVACVNVAHLLLARAAARQRELAIRTALGAGTRRIVRQLLTESTLLTTAGTILGLFVGWASLRVMIALRPASHDELRVARLDGTTLAVAAAVALLSGLIFGIAGALHSSRYSTHDALKTGSASSGMTRGQRRLRSLLVVSEIAFSAMLVVGAGLTVRSLERMQSADLGFDPHGLYTLYLNYGARSDSTAHIAALREVEQRLRAIPAVASMAAAEAGPGSRSFSFGRVEIQGEPAPSATATGLTDVNHVQPSYFATMGIHFVEGGPFADTTQHVVIVNALFARKHWPAGHALGQRLRLAQSGTEPWWTIVGVVSDVQSNGPGSASSAPSLYLPPSVSSEPSIVVRLSGDARQLQSLRPIARQVGLRSLTIESAETMVARSISEPRFVMFVLTTFSVVALVLASVGLYGVLAYMVAQEAREIGIRVALGATRGRIMRSVLQRGGLLAATGVAVGIAGALWGTKLIEKELYGVQRLDPASFIGGIVVLLVAAMLACIVPTRRALAVDPMSAIRAE